MNSNPTELDATAQAYLIRDKQLSPLELIDSAITAIERVNPKINAVITPLFDKARAQAKGGVIPDGPFSGVPFLLKDLICCSAGDPLYNGMRLFRDARFVAPVDTYLAQKFRAAGFITLGKTNTPELGLTATTEPEAFGPSRNPWDATRSTGGSSGGSAAAVAARMVPVAHANDGGGSIRIPASECGLVGLKPSRGRVSLGPLIGDAWHGLAIEGVVCRSVRDSAAVLDAIAGAMPGDPYASPPQNRPFRDELSVAPGKLRIGFMKRTPKGSDPLHPDCTAAVEATAQMLEALGHAVEESHPAALDEEDFAGYFADIVSANTVASLEEIGSLMLGRKLTAEDVELWTWQMASRAFNMSAAQYLTAVNWLQLWSRRVASWWSDDGYDLLLTPTIAAPPPPLGTLAATPDKPSTGLSRLMNLIPFTPPYNVTGQPAISLPLYWNAGGLPIGLHFVAPFGREDLLIRIAAQLESAYPWKERKPPICA